MKKIKSFSIISLFVLLCGCTPVKENSTSYIDELSNVTAEVRINSSDTESLKESNVAEAIKIVKECIEKSEDICSILDGKVTYILDEEGKNIFYNDSFEWIEIESDYSIEEIGTKLSDCLTGNLLNYYKYVLENHYMQDNGHLYIRATDSAIRDADYYFETLTVLEQQENFLSVRFDGFDNNYEQQIFVTAELVFEDDCWKLSVLSHI